MRELGVLAAIVIAASAARAEEPSSDRVRFLAKETVTQYDLGHYQAALKAAEELYQLKPTPGVLFNVAQCHRQLGHLKEAAHSYRLFLSYAEPESNEAVKARDLLAQVEAALKQQEAAVRAQPQGTAPLKATPPEWQTRPAPQAALPTVVYVPQPAAAPSHKAAYVLGVTTIAAVATGIAFGMASKNAANSLTSTIHSHADASDLAKTHDRDAHIADLCFAGAVALGLATVIAW
jgi:tetratricopeptide (TPR) repeat protein